MSRIEELGLPIPRKLEATKQEFDHILERRKLQNLDNHLEKSLNTIYCKFLAQKKRANLSQKQKKKKVNFSEDERGRWLMKISKPKKTFEPEILERVKGNVDTKRIARLAKPKHYPCPEPDINNIAEATLKYVPTDRIVSLAQPRKEKQDETVYEIPRIPFPTNPDYASVKSHGIDKLSRPPHPREKYRKVNVDVRCSYSPVSKGALQYEASAKIRKLATPKSVEEEELADVYKVKKKALKKLPKKMEKIFTKLSTPIEWKVTPKFETD